MLKHYRFDRNKLKVGWRTGKTGLAVFLVLLLFKLLNWEGTQIAALTAVFSLREDLGKSLSFGSSRILGNAIGGAMALVFYLVSGWFHHSYWVTLLLLPLLTMATIMLNVAMNNTVGVIGASSALLIITLGAPAGNTFLYVLTRVFQTFVGVFIAILVNSDVNYWKTLWKNRTMS